jgi:hypothetical protein
MARRRLAWSSGLLVAALTISIGLAVPARGEVGVVIGDAMVLAGTVVEVPIQMVAMGDAGVEPIQVAGIEFDLSWNSGVLFLESFVPAGPLESWLWVENLERARARIALASVDGFALDGIVVQVATLRFRTSPAPGSSAVTLEPIPIRTAALEPVQLIPIPGLIRTIAAVSSGSSSVGELKIAFRERE